MALPTYVGSGTFTTGTGAITPPFHASTAIDDIALLVVESENQAISLSAAQGFVEVGVQATKSAGTGGTNPANRIAVYWKRITVAGGGTAPTVADSGDHVTAAIHSFRGVKTTGDPWNVFTDGNDSGANDTTGVVPGATTTVANCLVVLICGSSNNATSSTQFSAWTNADLAALTERLDNTHTVGLGGGHGMATGEKAVAGAYTTTTVTLAVTSFKGTMSIALEGAGATTFTQAIPATAIGVATLSRVTTILKTLAATAIGIATLTPALLFSKTLAATAIGVAALTRVTTTLKTLATTAIGIASLTKIPTFARTLAATALGIPAVAQVTTFSRIMAATAIGVAALTKGMFVNLVTSSIGVAVLTSALTFLRTIAATAVGIPSVARATVYVRTLAATANGIASFVTEITVATTGAWVALIQERIAALHAQEVEATQGLEAKRASYRDIIERIAALAPR